MNAEDARLAVLVALGAAAAFIVLLGLVFRVTGTWERVLSRDEEEQGLRPERLTLGQLGPFVTGRRDVVGGHHEYSGIALGRALWLTRRDHGVDALKALGFPEAIAKQLDGEPTARLRLTLSEGHLRGTFTPQKVEFTHQPPRVTGAFFLPPQPRTYKRVHELQDAVRAPAKPARAEVLAEPTRT